MHLMKTVLKLLHPRGIINKTMKHLHTVERFRLRWNLGAVSIPAIKYCSALTIAKIISIILWHQDCEMNFPVM